MIKIVIFFVESTNSHIELTGLSKRVNAIGLQPIPGDQFNCNDLGKEDKEKIGGAVDCSEQNLVVTSRHFKFEDTHTAIYTLLKKWNKNLLLHSD